MQISAARIKLEVKRAYSLTAKHLIRIEETEGSIPSGSTMDSKQTGIWGEKIAENYLIKKGYQILDKNYSTNFNCRAKRGKEEGKALFAIGPKRGEVDLVTEKDNIISFIEVKTQTQNQRELFSLIRPEQKVNFLKQRKIIKTAEFWLMEKKIPLDSKWQIDVIAIKIDFKSKLAKIRHFKNSVF